MSGEDHQGHEVTFTVREYVESLFNAHYREHAAMDKALDKAEAARSEALHAASQTMNKRLDTMNEFRTQLKEQAATFATKEDLDPLRKFQDRFVGFALGLTILNGLMTALIVYVLKH